jgi:hypothetical protein
MQDQLTLALPGSEVEFQAPDHVSGHATERERIRDLKRRINSAYTLVDGHVDAFRALIPTINAGHTNYVNRASGGHRRNGPLHVTGFDGDEVHFQTPEGYPCQIWPSPVADH